MRAVLLIAVVIGCGAPQRPDPAPTAPTESADDEAVRLPSANKDGESPGETNTPVPWRCLSFKQNGGFSSRCETTITECAQAADDFRRDGATVGSCDAASAAYCHRAQFPEGRAFRVCFATMSHCRADTDFAETHARDVKVLSLCEAVPDDPRGDAEQRAHWWCSSEPGHDNGLCQRDRDGCEASRAEMGRQGLPYGACEGQTKAACYLAEDLLQGGQMKACYPTIAGCKKGAAFLATTKRDDWKMVLACEARE